MSWIKPGCCRRSAREALGIECRADDAASLAIVSRLDDSASRAAVTAERALLATLGGGCHVPLGARATVTAAAVTLRAAVLSPDGRQRIDASQSDAVAKAAELGRRLAEDLVSRVRGPCWGVEYFVALPCAARYLHFLSCHRLPLAHPAGWNFVGGTSCFAPCHACAVGSAPILPEQYRCRPCLESLEDRLAPALNLTISTLVTNAGVTVTDFGNVRTFEATASGANVNVGDILYALDNEFDVVVSTGSMVIGEDGDLTWNFTPALIFNGPDGDLSLQTSTATGDITLNSQIHAVFYYNADLNLTLSGAGNITANHTLALDSLNATTTGGTITLNAPVGAISSLDLDASVAVNVNDDVDVDEGNIDLAAATVTLARCCWRTKAASRSPAT